MTEAEAFAELTGLHRCFDKTPTWAKQTILRQRDTIRNLKAERAAMRKGYMRKIAKLERRIAELSGA